MLSYNQNYDLIRRCVIAFFAKGEDKLAEYGYEIADFTPAMKMVKDMYFDYAKKIEKEKGYIN